MAEINDKIKRLIDANFNRLREGLRVTEDISRFILDDIEITKRIKGLRSDIGMVESEFDFVLFRDTEGDIGLDINSDIEKKRENIADIAKANFKRVEESFRVLEELFKLIEPKISLKFKSLRYNSYLIEKLLIEKIEKR